MELVPIITQILGIVAAVFIIVLIVSFAASKLRKKDHEVLPQANNYGNQQLFNNGGINTRGDKSQYYGGTYYSNNLTYAKEIKVVKRSGISKSQSSKNYTQEPAYSNSRFTVINNISTKVNPKIETDEFGFKVYSNNEITRSVYLQN